MDVFLDLKICESCGCLWFRAQGHAKVYCSGCEVKFRDFPAPETRKRRGRPSRRTGPRNWWAGGVQ